MDTPARDFLADAALAGQQHLGVAPRGVFDFGPNRLHRRADTDKVVDRVFHSHSLLEPPRGSIVVLNEGRIPAGRNG